jgi:hypothetical protein
MTRFLPVLLLFLVAHMLSAQSYKNGFVRLQGGEELKGLIGDVVDGTPDGIQFKTELGAELKVYYANEIEGYGITNGLFYTSFKGPGPASDWEFVELLVKGQLTLIRKNSMFFVLPANENQFYHLTTVSGEYRGVLSSLMKNCPYVATQTAKVKLNSLDLAAHVTAFNECIAIKNPNFDGAPKSVSIAVVGGYDFTGSKFHDITNIANRFLASDKLYDQSFVQVGADLTLRHYRISNLFGLYTGLYFNTNSYRAVTNVKVNSNETEFNEFSLEYSEIKVPLGFEYSPPTRSAISFFFRTYLSFAKVQNIKSVHVSQELRSADGVVTYETPRNVVSISKRPQIGAGFGADYRIYRNSRIRLQLNYALGSGSADVQIGTASLTSAGNFRSFSVMTGFVF